MAQYVLAAIAMLIGMVALGAGGATARRRNATRWSLFALGAISTLASLVLLYRGGGFPMLAFVGSGLIVVTGAVVVGWYFVSMPMSLDDRTTSPESHALPDFSFLITQGNDANAQSPSPRRPSLATRILGTTAADRIARMRFLTGWSFMRRGP
jgi:hypothetical protein